MEEILKEFNDFSSTLTEEVQLALTFLSIILLATILINLLRGLIYVIINLPEALKALKKFIVFILNIILFPFKKFFQFLKWIFTAKKRRDYKKEVLSSEFNIYPEKYTIPFWRRFFSYKIRKEAKTRFRCIEKCIETQKFLEDNIKPVTLIEAAIGGGKSSLNSALSHSLTIKNLKDIDQKISNTEKILYEIDWKIINEIIAKNYTTCSINQIYKKIINDSHLRFNGFYNNYRQETPKKELLKDYITAYSAKLRNRFVMANYTLYNHISNNFCYKLKNTALNIKDEEARKDYYLPAYCTFIEDELSLEDVKNTSSHFDLDNKGRDTALRLFRHLKKETTYYIGSSQNTSRVAKIIRELSNLYIIIEKMDVVGTQKTFSRIFQKKEMKKENKLKKISSDINTYKELNDLTGDLKKEIFINYQEQNKIFASGFVRYRIKLAKSLKELDRWDTSNLKSFDAYFPMTWCFGTYLTCQFSELDDYLNTQSNKTDNDLSFLDDFYKSTDPKDFEYMLKNTELRKKEKEEKSKSKKKETNNASL